MSTLDILSKLVKKIFKFQLKKTAKVEWLVLTFFWSRKSEKKIEIWPEPKKIVQVVKKISKFQLKKTAKVELDADTFDFRLWLSQMLVLFLGLASLSWRS